MGMCQCTQKELEQAKVSNVNVDELNNNSENYKKAIDCLNKQFDCHINLRFINEPRESDDLFTSIYNNSKQNFSISKSKGFQLNG